MTPDDLLRPRYKVIADYPKMECEVGDIFHKLTFDNGNYTYVTNHDSPMLGRIIGHMIERMPHLFKPLAWWEERKPEEMPEYVNCPSRKMFLKIEHWGESYFIIEGRQKMQYRNYTPATREEYEAYQKTKT